MHVEQILLLLYPHQFYAKFSKCLFGVTLVDYLGHIISHQGVQVDLDNIKAMMDWSTPTSFTTLRVFLSLIGFYRQFFHHYATIASPLTDLLKSSTFLWPTAADTTFIQLKDAMLHLPLLHLLDFEVPVEVTINASNAAIGVVLSQNHYPIAFFF